MKKLVYGRKMSRNFGARKGLKFSLVRSFIYHGKIKTTLTKAKFVQKDIEKIVSLTIRNKGNCFADILSKVRNDKQLAFKIVELGKKYEGSRKSGFTKRTQLFPRKGDNSAMAIIQWSENMSFTKDVSKNKAVKDKNKGKNLPSKDKKMKKEDVKIKKSKSVETEKKSKKSVK